VAKGVLPYHGIGSGIKRALADWPDITFTDDRDGCLFTATVNRKAVASTKTPGKTPGKTPVENAKSGKTPLKTPPKTPLKIMDLLLTEPTLSLPEIARALSKSGDVKGVRGREGDRREGDRETASALVKALVKGTGKQRQDGALVKGTGKQRQDAAGISRRW
jgi:hypothetical protein